MRTTLLGILAMLLLTLTGCEREPKVLIAYFSHGGNTAVLANMIRDSIGGDVFVIEPETPYPAEGTHDAARAQMDAGELPALKGSVEGLEAYDIVFVGTPNWFNGVALPVKAFLQNNDLAGKKVIPFATFGGSVGNSMTDIEVLCPQSTVLEGFSVSGDEVKGKPEEVRKKVGAWLKQFAASKN